MLRSVQVLFLILLQTLPLHAQAPSEGSGQNAPPRPSSSKPIDEAEGTIEPKDLLKHLEFLASDEMKGRLTGSDESKKAADYIVEHMKSHGIVPAGDAKSYETKFGALGKLGTNLCGVLPGTDPRLKSEYVVLGAHYDHVGIGAAGSRTPARRGEIHNGADDNASGSSSLLELMQAFSKKPTKRSILFIAFSGEELGLLGSKAWVKNPTVPIKSIAAMINLDMVGRSKNSYCFIGGLNTGSGFEKLVRDINKDLALDLELNGGGRGPSDHDSFYTAQVPVMFFFTAEHNEYHTPDDDVALINTNDQALITRFAYRLSRAIAEGPRPKFEKDDRQAMPATSERALDQARHYLGIRVLDGDGEEGVPITEVEKSGAASDAGIAIEDRLLTLDGTKVSSKKDLQGFLAMKRPGSSLKVVVTRGKQKKRLTFTIKLRDR